ncbi:mucin-4-like isoform X2 [Dreissena polymorpha]|uniref:mucin-4-like isoform X2 n=1 Tax=Dreissena polymorpha TaxID=45954 RepID=UPI002264977C|nr:mucin-4-like isoform X2 [Dreissena polymorpha]
MLKTCLYVYIVLVSCYNYALSNVLPTSGRPLNLPPDLIDAVSRHDHGSSSVETDPGFPGVRYAPKLDTPDVNQGSYTDNSELRHNDAAELPEIGSDRYDRELSAENRTLKGKDHGPSHNKRDIEAASSYEDGSSWQGIDLSSETHTNDTSDTGILFDTMHGNDDQPIEQHAGGFQSTNTVREPEHRPFLLDSSVEKVSPQLPTLSTRTTPRMNALLEHGVDHINVDESGLPGYIDNHHIENEERHSNANLQEQTNKMLQTTEENTPAVRESSNELGHIAYLSNGGPEYESSHQTHSEFGDSHTGVDVPIDKGVHVTPGYIVNASNQWTTSNLTNRPSIEIRNITIEKIAILPTPASTESNGRVEPTDDHRNIPVVDHGHGNIAIIDGNSEELTGHAAGHETEGHEAGTHEHTGDGHLVPGEGHIESHTTIPAPGGVAKPDKEEGKEWDIKPTTRSTNYNASTEALTLRVLEPSKESIEPTLSYESHNDSSYPARHMPSFYSDYEYDSDFYFITDFLSGERNTAVVSGTTSENTSPILTSTHSTITSSSVTSMVNPSSSPRDTASTTISETNHKVLFSTKTSESTEQSLDTFQSSEMVPSFYSSARTGTNTELSERTRHIPEQTQYLEPSSFRYNFVSSSTSILHYTQTPSTALTSASSSSRYSGELTDTLPSDSGVLTISTSPPSIATSVPLQEQRTIIATPSQTLYVTQMTDTPDQNSESHRNVTNFVTIPFIAKNESTHHSEEPERELIPTTMSSVNQNATTRPGVTQPFLGNTTTTTTIFTMAVNTSRRTLKPFSRISLPPILTEFTRLTSAASLPNTSVSSLVTGNQVVSSTTTPVGRTTKKTGTTKDKDEPDVGGNDGRVTARPAHKSTLGPDVSLSPPVFIQISLRMSWVQFCSAKTNFISTLSEILSVKKDVSLTIEQIKIPNLPMEYCPTDLNPLLLDSDAPGEITVEMYIVDRAGKVDITLTVDASSVLEKGFRDSTSIFKDKIVTVTLQRLHTSPPDPVVNTSQKAHSGVTMVIIIASVGGVCCVMLVVLQVLLHRRVKAKKARFFVSQQPSIHSLDHVALGAIPKSRPGSGYWNPALADTAELPEIAEYSHTMSYSALANFCMDEAAVQAEFQTIPECTVDSSSVPVGVEDKNRFANVLPHKHSRVKLQTDDVNTSDYINANYVNGYMGERKVYIATQSPLVNTVNDFWRMVWQEQSRVVLTLNPLGANGKPKQSTCYWPDSLNTDQRREFSDLIVTLKKRDEQRDYVDCTLEILDIERNLKRQVHHFQLTCWPDTRPPEPLSLVKFVLDTRPHYENSRKPVIINCGPGTGRTCTLIALDTCMRMFEDQRRVDVFGCVHRLRGERAGAVQTREQYLLLYQALNEYAVILNSPSVSTRSSVITLHAML